ncbi:microtubule-associated protein futsch isoform X2 [Cherax quadricarinatus]|uniref:microtubule-associated protein futsch isoform X2 n=1 Tax=Cherax quadricarinatus TaxID=27406 RepID=UPI00387E7980
MDQLIRELSHRCLPVRQLKKLLKNHMSQNHMKNQHKWVKVAKRLVNEAVDSASEILFENVFRITKINTEKAVERGLKNPQSDGLLYRVLLGSLIKHVHCAVENSEFSGSEITRLISLLLSAVIDMEAASVRTEEVPVAVSKISTNFILMLGHCQEHILDTLLHCRTLIFHNERRPWIYVPLIKRLLSSVKNGKTLSPQLYLKYVLLAKLLLSMTRKEEVIQVKTLIMKAVKMPVTFGDWANQNKIPWLNLDSYNTRLILKSMKLSAALKTLYGDKALASAQETDSQTPNKNNNNLFQTSDNVVKQNDCEKILKKSKETVNSKLKSKLPALQSIEIAQGKPNCKVAANIGKRISNVDSGMVKKRNVKSLNISHSCILKKQEDVDERKIKVPNANSQKCCPYDVKNKTNVNSQIYCINDVNNKKEKCTRKVVSDLNTNEGQQGVIKAKKLCDMTLNEGKHTNDNFKVNRKSKPKMEGILGLNIDELQIVVKPKKKEELHGVKAKLKSQVSNTDTVELENDRNMEIEMDVNIPETQVVAKAKKKKKMVGITGNEGKHTSGMDFERDKKGNVKVENYSCLNGHEAQEKVVKMKKRLHDTKTDKNASTVDILDKNINVNLEKNFYLDIGEMQLEELKTKKKKKAQSVAMVTRVKSTNDIDFGTDKKARKKVKEDKEQEVMKVQKMKNLQNMTVNMGKHTNDNDFGLGRKSSMIEGKNSVAESRKAQQKVAKAKTNKKISDFGRENTKNVIKENFCLKGHELQEEVVKVKKMRIVHEMGKFVNHVNVWREKKDNVKVEKISCFEIQNTSQEVVKTKKRKEMAKLKKSNIRVGEISGTGVHETQKVVITKKKKSDENAENDMKGKAKVENMTDLDSNEMDQFGKTMKTEQLGRTLKRKLLLDAKKPVKQLKFSYGWEVCDKKVSTGVEKVIKMKQLKTLERDYLKEYPDSVKKKGKINVKEDTENSLAVKSKCRKHKNIETTVSNKEAGVFAENSGLVSLNKEANSYASNLCVSKNISVAAGQTEKSLVQNKGSIYSGLNIRTPSDQIQHSRTAVVKPEVKFSDQPTMETKIHFQTRERRLNCERGLIYRKTKRELTNIRQRKRRNAINFTVTNLEPKMPQSHLNIKSEYTKKDDKQIEKNRKDTSLKTKTVSPAVAYSVKLSDEFEGDCKIPCLLQSYDIEVLDESGTNMSNAFNDLGFRSDTVSEVDRCMKEYLGKVKNCEVADELGFKDSDPWNCFKLRENQSEIKNELDSSRAISDSGDVGKLESQLATVTMENDWVSDCFGSEEGKNSDTFLSKNDFGKLFNEIDPSDKKEMRSSEVGEVSAVVTSKKNSTPSAVCPENSDSDIEILTEESLKTSKSSLSLTFHDACDVDEASGSDSDIVPCDEETKMFTDEEIKSYHTKLKDAVIQKKVEDILKEDEKELKMKLTEDKKMNVTNTEGREKNKDKSRHQETIKKPKADAAGDLVSQMINKLYKTSSEKKDEELKEHSCHEPDSEDDIEIILQTIVKDTGKETSIHGLRERFSSSLAIMKEDSSESVEQNLVESEAQKTEPLKNVSDCNEEKVHGPKDLVSHMRNKICNSYLEEGKKALKEHVSYGPDSEDGIKIIQQTIVKDIEQLTNLHGSHKKELSITVKEMPSKAVIQETLTTGEVQRTEIIEKSPNSNKNFKTIEEREILVPFNKYSHENKEFIDKVYKDQKTEIINNEDLKCKNQETEPAGKEKLKLNEDKDIEFLEVKISKESNEVCGLNVKLETKDTRQTSSCVSNEMFLNSGISKNNARIINDSFVHETKIKGVDDNVILMPKIDLPDKVKLTKDKLSRTMFNNKEEKYSISQNKNVNVCETNVRSNNNNTTKTDLTEEVLKKGNSEETDSVGVLEENEIIVSNCENDGFVVDFPVMEHLIKREDFPQNSVNINPSEATLKKQEENLSCVSGKIFDSNGDIQLNNSDERTMSFEPVIEEFDGRPAEGTDEAYEASSDASENPTPKVRKKTRALRRNLVAHEVSQEASDSDASTVQSSRRSWLSEVALITHLEPIGRGSKVSLETGNSVCDFSNTSRASHTSSESITAETENMIRTDSFNLRSSSECFKSNELDNKQNISDAVMPVTEVSRSNTSSFSSTRSSESISELPVNDIVKDRNIELLKVEDARKRSPGSPVRRSSRIATKLADQQKQQSDSTVEFSCSSIATLADGSTKDADNTCLDNEYEACNFAMEEKCAVVENDSNHLCFGFDGFSPPVSPRSKQDQPRFTSEAERKLTSTQNHEECEDDFDAQNVERMSNVFSGMVTEMDGILRISENKIAIEQLDERENNVEDNEILDEKKSDTEYFDEDGEELEVLSTSGAEESEDVSCCHSASVGGSNSDKTGISTTRIMLQSLSRQPSCKRGSKKSFSDTKRDDIHLSIPHLEVHCVSEAVLTKEVLISPEVSDEECELVSPGIVNDSSEAKTFSLPEHLATSSKMIPSPISLSTCDAKKHSGGIRSPQKVIPEEQDESTLPNSKGETVVKMSDALKTKPQASPGTVSCFNSYDKSIITGKLPRAIVLVQKMSLSNHDVPKSPKTSIGKTSSSNLESSTLHLSTKHSLSGKGCLPVEKSSQEKSTTKVSLVKKSSFEDFHNSVKVDNETSAHTSRLIRSSKLVEASPIPFEVTGGYTDHVNCSPEKLLLRIPTEENDSASNKLSFSEESDLKNSKRRRYDSESKVLLEEMIVTEKMTYKHDENEKLSDSYLKQHKEEGRSDLSSSNQDKSLIHFEGIEDKYAPKNSFSDISVSSAGLRRSKRLRKNEEIPSFAANDKETISNSIAAAQNEKKAREEETTDAARKSNFSTPTSLRTDELPSELSNSLVTRKRSHLMVKKATCGVTECLSAINEHQISVGQVIKIAYPTIGSFAQLTSTREGSPKVMASMKEKLPGHLSLTKVPLDSSFTCEAETSSTGGNGPVGTTPSKHHFHMKPPQSTAQVCSKKDESALTLLLKGGLQVTSPNIVGSAIKSPIKARSPSKSPIKARSPSKSPIKARSPSKSPIKVRSPSKSPIKVRSSSKSPVKVRSSSKSPIKVRSSSKSPIKVRSSSKSPIKARSPSKSPIKVRSPSKSPIKVRSPSKSPTKARSPSKSPTKTRSPSKSPTKTRSPSKSPTKARSPSKSPTKARSPSKSPIKTRSPSKSPIKAKSPSKSPIKARSPAKSPIKVRSPTKSPIKVRSPTKSPIKVRSPTISPIKTRSSVKSPVGTRSPVKPSKKISSPAKFSIKVSTLTKFPKVRSAESPRVVKSPAESPKVRSPAESPKKVRSPAESTKEVRSPAESAKVRLPAESPEEVRSPAKSPEKVRSPAESTKEVRSPAESTKVRLPAESPKEVRSPAESPEVVRSPAESPKEIRTPVESLEEVRSPAESPKEVRSPAESPEEVRPPAESPKEVRPPAESPKEVQPPAESFEEVRSPTESPREVRSPAESPKEVRSPAESPREVRSPAESPKEARSPAESPKEVRSPAKSPKVVRSPADSPKRSPKKSQSPVKTPKEVMLPKSPNVWSLVQSSSKNEPCQKLSLTSSLSKNESQIKSFCRTPAKSSPSPKMPLAKSSSEENEELSTSSFIKNEAVFRQCLSKIESPPSIIHSNSESPTGSSMTMDDSSVNMHTRVNETPSRSSVNVIESPSQSRLNKNDLPASSKSSASLPDHEKNEPSYEV